FYNLGDVAKRNTGRVLAKDSFWRKRYALLQNLPIAQYPRDAYDYALEDSTATLETRQAQEANKFSVKVLQNVHGLDPLADQYRQVMAALPLRAMSAYGLRTDAGAVARCEEDVRAMQLELREQMQAVGLVKRKVSRDTKAIAKRCAEIGVPSAKKA